MRTIYKRGGSLRTMEADGPEEIAEIILTPCIFRKGEKARIVEPVMTVGNHPATGPYHKYSH
ncbi:MAG: hypothetical protein V2J65_00980 [Desulfobacteraceae bacterium]|jgi:hypothetical protein|nr:hypothetical protein [Desulfobacteraceae bacterium]